MSMPPLPKDFGRAFDLSSLKNPAPHVANVGIAVNQTNLMQEIIPESNNQVVILICWSPRSPESQRVLDSLGKMHAEDSAAEGGAGWILGSVNVDQEPSVATALQVQSVPLAIALIQEQLVPLFETVPTDEQLRMVINKVLALASERGIGKAAGENSGGSQVGQPIEEKLEPEEQAALTALEAGDFAAAATSYKQWLLRSPGNSLASAGLAQVELMLRIQGVDFNSAISSADSSPENIEAQLLAADVQISQGDLDGSFNRLITLVKKTTGEDRKKVREHLLSLFTLIDPEDPKLIQARQLLASALF
ncbi:MAG: tetratricopeptide repeat protein [Actinomycetes bacterium]